MVGVFRTVFGMRFLIDFQSKIISSYRKILNEADLIDKLRKKDFEIINPQHFEIVEQRSIAFIIQRDRRDDPIYTKKGYFISSKVKSSGYQLGGERDYIKFDYTLQSYLPIASNSVFAKRFKFGRIWGWDNKIDDVAREKFYLGGSNTMRGWNFPLFKTSQDTTFQNDTLNILITEVPKGDLVRFMTNIEYRLPVYESFGLTLFADGAVLENNLEKINLDYLEWNLGIGITIKTPLGPARLDYAFKPKSPNRGIIQLGLQNLF